MDLKYYCDDMRHLVCVPYSIENLHKMADDLNIKRCWFHKDHYDIPKRRVDEIHEKCEMVCRITIARLARDDKEIHKRWADVFPNITRE
jgi:hypothetical protein